MPAKMIKMGDKYVIIKACDMLDCDAVACFGTTIKDGDKMAAQNVLKRSKFDKVSMKGDFLSWNHKYIMEGK